MSTHKRRRRYTAEFKEKILADAARCTKRGELRELLEREGLYSSHLVAWRRQMAKGLREALQPRKRGPKPTAKVVELGAEVDALRTQCDRLDRRIDELIKLLDTLVATSQERGK